MNELQTFSNSEFGAIRTLNIDNAPWFVGKDVAAALGYKEPTKATRDKVDAEDRGMSKIDPPLRYAIYGHHQRKRFVLSHPIQ